MKSIYKASLTPFLLLISLFLGSYTAIAQYTDVINSNRPGQSVSAYAVGANVAQVEAGINYESGEHSLLQTESTFIGGDIALRYGLFFEPLEIYYEGTYLKENITYNSFNTEDSRTNFTRNRIGLKYLIYDPFKNPENNKPNLYSWKANHGFKLKNLIPAVSLYAGANFVLGDNPFYPEDPTVSPRAMIATQSRLTPRVVLITNTSYDRIGTDYPEWSYIVSITRALRNPKYSVFIEHQGIKSDRYSDMLLRTGMAYLFNESFQADINFGGSFKNTPSRFFASLGASYRLDFHKDKLVPIEDQEAGQNGKIKKNSVKKKKKEKKKQLRSGSGAEDVDLGPSKKQLRNLKKKEKQAKKKQKQNSGAIDF